MQIAPVVGGRRSATRTARAPVNWRKKTKTPNSTMKPSLGYAATREAQPGDAELIFHRDANSWCPWCHRVWSLACGVSHDQSLVFYFEPEMCRFWLEQRGLRFATSKVHLRARAASQLTVFKILRWVF